MNPSAAELLERHPGVGIVIFGAGAGGRVILQECRKAGRNVLYFADNHKEGEIFEGVPVRSPYDLMYEEPGSFFILIGACRAGSCREIGKQLEGMGFTAEKDFAVPESGNLYAPMDLFDPFLGYGRNSDFHGFRITPGLTEKAEKIVILGGSTSDSSFGGFPAWPELFAGLLKKNGLDYAVYNGAAAGYLSAQELMKFLRDAVPLSPFLVITMDGFNDGTQPRSENHPFCHPYLPQTVDLMFAHAPRDPMDINGEIRGVEYGVPDPIGRADSWCRNLRLLHGAASGCGIRHTGFLQPVSSLSRHSVFEQSEAVLAFYREALEKKPDFIVNAVSSLDETLDAYFDYAHYSLKGNEALAAFVFRTVRPLLEKKGEEP